LDMLSIGDNGLIIKDGTRLLIPEGMRTWWIDYLQNLHSSPEREPENQSGGRLSTQIWSNEGELAKHVLNSLRQTRWIR
jgi:hypothetical protein